VKCTSRGKAMNSEKKDWSRANGFKKGAPSTQKNSQVVCKSVR
jgi:hypothetical protein